MDGGTNGDDARPMTGAELRCITYALGLSRDSLARLLHVAPRGVERILYGARPVPPGIAAEVHAWRARADDELAAMMVTARADPSRPVITYRDDDEYRATHPGDRMPAAWHRALVARLLERMPDVTVTYADDDAV